MRAVFGVDARMSTCVRVEEIDGPYGPFAIGERAIQRLWASGEVRGPMAAASGATIEILHPGDWNRGAGPDFLAAQILVDAAVTGRPTDRFGRLHPEQRVSTWLPTPLRCATWAL